MKLILCSQKGMGFNLLNIFLQKVFKIKWFYILKRKPKELRSLHQVLKVSILDKTPEDQNSDSSILPFSNSILFEFKYEKWVTYSTKSTPSANTDLNFSPISVQCTAGVLSTEPHCSRTGLRLLSIWSCHLLCQHLGSSSALHSKNPGSCHWPPRNCLCWRFSWGMFGDIDMPYFHLSRAEEYGSFNLGSLDDPGKVSCYLHCQNE